MLISRAVWVSQVENLALYFCMRAFCFHHDTDFPQCFVAKFIHSTKMAHRKRESSEIMKFF